MTYALGFDCNRSIYKKGSANFTKVLILRGPAPIRLTTCCCGLGMQYILWYCTVWYVSWRSKKMKLIETNIEWPQTD